MRDRRAGTWSAIPKIASPMKSMLHREGRVAAHIYLTLVVKGFKISVEYDRMVTTSNIIKHYI
jgi:hypothetical protein